MSCAKVLASATLLHAVLALARGDVLHVPFEYPTIFDAVYAARDGDVVLVADGVYEHGVSNFFGKKITVRSENGPAACVIRGQAAGFNFESGEGRETRVEGFTLDGRPIKCVGTSPTVTNCVVTNCSSKGVLVSEASPIFEDCVFKNNLGHWGGGMMVVDSTVTLRRCAFTGNTAGQSYSSQGGGLWASSSTVLIENCEFKNNRSVLNAGGALFSKSCSVVIRGTRFESNTALAGGGAILALESDGALVNCEFVRNSSLSSSSAVLLMGKTEASLVNCSFLQNGSPASGSTCEVGTAAGFALVANCVFSGNVGKWEPVLSLSSSANVINCTFTDNVIAAAGFPVVYAPLPTSLRGCLLWNNQPPQTTFASTLDLAYCLLESPWPGPGNISADPLFVDPRNGDYRLAAGSPCIDAGDNVALPADTYDLDGDGNLSEPLPIDLGGFARRVDDPDTPNSGNGRPPVVDIGAYEFQGCVGDLNGDKVVDQADLALLLAAFETCPGDPGYNVAANLAFYGPGGDCINQSDLGVLLSVYGANCSRP